MDLLSKLKITSRLLRRIAEIDEFKGRWQALGKISPDRLSTLRRIATIESTGSSTRIEGVKLTNKEVERLLSGAHIHSFKTRDEQEVIGYGELMEMIFDSWKEISLTENHIKQLHGVLLKHSQKDERHRGNYKKLPNDVAAFDADRKSLGIIFKTATPFDTPAKMESLVRWTHDALEAQKHHPLLVIAAFVVRFLAIHPFQDGNGRLSRALTTLLLLRSGYAYAPYSSMEKVIEDNKIQYYKALRDSQAGDMAGEALVPWAEFFLDCLTAQKNTLARKMEHEKKIAALPELSRQLVELVRDHGRLTMKGAVKITGANRNTLKIHLRALAKSRRLIRKGTGRGTWYKSGD